jgi:titin
MDRHRDQRTGYRVERSTDNVTFGVIATLGVGAVSYADSSGAPATTYYYRVQAFNAVGPSGYSNTANATTPQVAPAAPSGLTATLSGTTVNLLWVDGSTNEDGFKVERSTDNVTFGVITTLGAGATSYADTSGVPAQTYYYRVQAFNTAGPSAYSNTESATLPPPAVVAPGAPTALGASVFRRRR